jgi:predicted  nucleic acid-binding Zn-ribbon protein
MVDNAALEEMAKHIATVEEDHNAVLDVLHDKEERLETLKEQIEGISGVVANDIEDLKEQTKQASIKVERASIIISLLGMKEELRVLQDRINNQPYEQYAESKWFERVIGQQQKTP